MEWLEQPPSLRRGRVAFTIEHAPHDGADRLVRHTILRGHVAQAFVLGALGDFRPKGRIDLGLLLRRAREHNRDIDGEVRVGEFVLAGLFPIRSASATLTLPFSPPWVFLGGRRFAILPPMLT